MPLEVVPIFDVRDYDAQVQRAADLLRTGGVVVLPTETLYGAAGQLANRETLQRLKELRQGTDERPLTVHLAHPDDARHYLGDVPEIAHRLMSKVWPGPVGIQFEVPPDRQAEIARTLGIEPADLFHDNRITLRCPDQVVAGDVLALLAAPAVLTAVATPPGEGAASLGDTLNGKVDLVLDCGPPRYSRPSTLVRIVGESYEIVREGAWDRRTIERMLRTTVLFVCSGNTCRSPMAEALTRKLLSDHHQVASDDLERKGIVVMSAGSYAYPGSPATPQAVEAVVELGADLSRHRSRPLVPELVHQADHILVMGRSHLEAVLALTPSAADKVALLDNDGDIEDPIGAELGVYTDLARRMLPMIQQRLHERGLL